MLFSSKSFIFGFLPVLLLVYYISPKKLKNLVLFTGSIIFYALGELKYLPLLLLTLSINYFAAVLIGVSEKKSIKTVNFIMVLLYDFLLLAGFKYFSKSIPLGISFYIFQISAYVMDVYMGKVKAEKNIINLGTYLCMFPQLIAGPIILYTDISKEIRRREHSLEKFEDGLKLFIAGLGSKVLIADVFAMLWNEISVTGYDSITTPLAWLGALAFTIEIYFDFNGYSLMAAGLGKMFGFTIPKNFDDPYTSKSVTEFFRRWHMTLGRWFKDYIYIPLGGNRHGRVRMIFNLFVVWLFTGMWHGNGANYIIWGLSIFVLLVVEKLFLKKYLDKSRIFSTIYMFIFIPVSWMIFAITNLSDLGIYLLRMFPFLGNSASPYINHSDYIDALQRYGVFFVIALILCTPLAGKLYPKFKKKTPVLLLLLAIFWAAVYRISVSADNPFLYFRF